MVMVLAPLKRPPARGAAKDGGQASQEDADEPVVAMPPAAADDAGKG
jgi:hypothetical protein